MKVKQLIDNLSKLDGDEQVYALVWSRGQFADYPPFPSQDEWAEAVDYLEESSHMDDALSRIHESLRDAIDYAKGDR